MATDVARRKEDDYDDRPLHSLILDTILLPIQALISLPARRLYLRTLLLTLSIPIHATFSIIAYISFYTSYVPSISFTRPIYLQFHPENLHPPNGVTSLSLPHSADPWGIASSPLVSQQPYDVTLTLLLPRSPSNLEAGNFMLTLDLLGPGNGSTPTDSTAPTTDSITYPVLATASRPAILTYRSSLIRRAGTLAGIVPYTLGWRREEERLSVSMMRGWSAERGWRNVPSSVRLELGSKERLEVYEVEVSFKARFTGLRWLLHNHRIISFVVGTTAFFTVELGAMMVMFAVFTYLFGSTAPSSRSVVSSTTNEGKRIKAEDETSFSDTTRTFPRGTRSPPLKYPSTLSFQNRNQDDTQEPQIKTEPPADADIEDLNDEEDEDADFVLDTPLPPVGTAAGGGRSDSGLGTSLESGSASGGALRRRTSGGKRLA